MTLPPAQTALASKIEAVLTVLGEPVTTEELAQAFAIEPAEVAAAFEQLVTEYETGRRTGFELRETAGGWRYYSRAEHFETVKAFLTRGQSAKLSQAALETLAVVAYAQPITRARIAAIRGVNVDGVVRTLLMRGLIVEAPVTQGPAQFVTSAVFLEALGMSSLDELPALAPYLPDDVTEEPPQNG